MHVAVDPTGEAEITATIQNHSNVLVHQVTLLVTMQDTPDGKPNFKDPDILSHGTIAFPVDIPGGATREAKAYARFGGPSLRPHGRIAWTQEILAVR